MPTKKPKPIGSQNDLRDMLLSAGVGQFNAVMSIPYMNFLPSTTDPYAQGVIQIVESLQRLLNMRGANLTVDGGMGPDTVAALLPFAGPLWFDKSWSQLMGDVMTGAPWPGWKRRGRVMPAPTAELSSSTAPSATGDVIDFVTSPPGLALLVVGGFIAHDHWKKRRGRRRSS